MDSMLLLGGLKRAGKTWVGNEARWRKTAEAAYDTMVWHYSLGKY
jgi:hypothetical protein